VASIQVEGLVGSKVLQVDAGSDAASPVSSGTVLPSREPVEIGAVIQQSAELIRKVDDAVTDVQQRVLTTIDTLTEVGETSRTVVSSVGQDAERLLGTTRKIAGDIDAVTEGIRKGRGLVGKLLTDDQFYTRVENVAKHAETAAANLSRTSDDARKIWADVESRKLGESFQKTADNVQQVTAHLKDVLAQLSPPDAPGERGLLDDMRDSLDNTRKATSDLAENMEALKRNWFFRGYFNKRGFFDLDAVSLEDYRQGKIAPDRERKRSWLHAQELFIEDQAGRESLSDSGLNKLGDAIVSYLRYAPNTLLIVEGYAAQGSEPEQFLRSRDRALLVRRHLIDRFGLKSNYVGAIPMGAVPSSAPSGEPWEGVSLVFFPDKAK
jgi:phospholipid/cholesterol/gamma-HCH transport system substrate-binding protein